MADMHLLRIVIAALICAIPVAIPAYAQDPDDFIGQAFRELDRHRQRRQTNSTQRLERLWQQCGTNLAACDAVLQYPNLTPQARAFIQNYRNTVAAQQQQRYQAFLSNWKSCNSTHDLQACNAALQFPDLNPADRQHLLGWRALGIQQQELAEAERRAQAERAERERIEAGQRQLEAIREQVRTREAEQSQADMARRRAERAERERRIQAGEAQRKQELFMLVGAAGAGLLVLGLIVFGIRRAMQDRSPGTPVTPPEFGAPPTISNGARQSSVPSVVPDVQLTGHFPTDVRRALAS